MTTQEQALQIDASITRVAESGWSSLYKIGGAAALISLVFFPIQIAVFLIVPPPETVGGWFELLRQSPIIGLLDLDLLLMVDQVLAILIFLALFVSLRRTSMSWMTVGTTLGIVSAVLFIAPNPAFVMLNLSSQYAAATGAAQQDILLAAGQAVITAQEGSAFHASYLLGVLAPILMSVVMLRSELFRKSTAYLGILSNGMALGLYVPVIGTYISVFSVVFLWVWYLLMGRDLLRLAKTPGI